MQLNSDQKLALNNGEPVPVLIDQTECIVIRRDVFDRVKDANLEETYPAVLEAWDSTGSPDDGALYK